MVSAVSANAQTILVQDLVALSNARSWESALTEWTPTSVEPLSSDEEGEPCLCLRDRLEEIWRISNTHTRETAIIGNCCIEKFTDSPQFENKHRILECVKKLRKDPSAFAERDLMKYAFQQKILSLDDHLFYQLLRHQKGLSSPEARRRKRQLNERLILRLKSSCQDRKLPRQETARALLYPQTLNNRLSGEAPSFLQGRVSPNRKGRQVPCRNLINSSANPAVNGRDCARAAVRWARHTRKRKSSPCSHTAN